MKLPTRIAGYDVVRPIAAGGMGMVVLAERVVVGGFRRQVAIKLILPHLLGDADATTLFADEARLAARFTHPNLVPAIDFGEDDGCFFMVLEFVDGISVRAMMQQSNGALPCAAVAQIAIDASRGLAWAHALADEHGHPLGVVHRDITPDNLFLARTGSVRVLDFGIARSRLGAHVTQAGVLRGKPQYLSPEQVSGGAVDAQADVWSLGVVLFELLSGASPFRGEGMQLMRAVLESPLPSLPAEVPAPLRELVARMMTRDPRVRCTMLEVADGWQRWLSEQPEAASREALSPWLDATGSSGASPSLRGDHEATVVHAHVSPPVRQRWPFAAAGALLLAAIVVVATSTQTKPQPPVPPPPLAVVAPMLAPTIAAVVEQPPMPVPAEAPVPTAPRPAKQREAMVVADPPAVEPKPADAPAGFFVPNRRPYVDVYVDGVKVGVSPLGSRRKPVAIAAGTHAVELTDPSTGTVVLRRAMSFAPKSVYVIE